MDKRFQVFQRMKINNSIKEFEMDNDDKKYIPALRFPEFLNDEKWKIVNGNELFESIVNKKHDSNLPVLAITQEYGAVPRDTINYNVIVSDKSIEGYKVVEIGDFIISLRSFQGGIEYSRYKGICSPAYIILRKRSDNICNDFYRFYFKSHQYIQNLNSKIEGIRDGKMISYKQFSDIKIPFPHPIEQKKVADCLSSLDKHIDATKRKLDQLKEHKKGVMQRIFPTKGKTIPELRFSKFKGKWIEKKLGQMCHLTNGMAFKPSDWTEKGIPIVRIQNLNDENASFNYCDPDIIDNKYMIDTGTLLFSWSGTPGTSFGAYIWNRGKAVLNQHIFIVKTLGIDKIFFKMIIDANMASIIEKSHGGAGLRHITKTELENIKVFVSEDDIEQRKIASFLLSMDNIISVYTNKLNLLVEYKKGLMQQLFPKL